MPEAHDSRGLLAFDEAGEDTRWMTYAELALARGIGTASAKRLAFRRRWRRQAGNDGTARVAVPLAEATRRTGRHDAADDVARLVSGLEAALATLQSELDRERDRADRAEQAAEQGALRLAEADAQIARLRAATDTAALVKDSLERALTAEERARRSAEAGAVLERSARADADAVAEALRQADQDRRRLGWVARLWAAWRDGAAGE
jgi:hypothetical protein